MRITFKRADGRRIAVNPAEVAAVLEQGDDGAGERTVLLLNNGRAYVVVGVFDAIESQLDGNVLQQVPTPNAPAAETQQ